MDEVRVGLRGRGHSLALWECVDGGEGGGGSMRNGLGKGEGRGGKRSRVENENSKFKGESACEIKNEMMARFHQSEKG